MFEFVDKDLKKYFETCDGPLSSALIKVLRLNDEFKLNLCRHLDASSYCVALSN